MYDQSWFLLADIALYSQQENNVCDIRYKKNAWPSPNEYTFISGN